MKGRWLWAVVCANLLVLVGLAFAYPQAMVSPGPLLPGHAALADDCFACHAPLRGATTERCIACHAVPDIGLRATKGLPIQAAQAGRAARLTISFHQQLAEQDCMACHGDHAAPRLNKGHRKSFSHAALRLPTREGCAACHVAPANAVHKSLSAGCVQCHKTDAWKPAGFDHAALPQAELARCESCHKAPTDTLHRQINGRCAQCHAPKAWKPATFEHDKLFRLDRDHQASCATCHLGDDYSQYTCYGCHEHSAANIRRKHVEEGIQNYENCVKCHRSAEGEREGKGGREGGGERRHGGDD